jgi:hypothetical protein
MINRYLLVFSLSTLTDTKGRSMSSFTLIDGARKGRLDVVQAAILGGNDVNITKLYGHRCTALYIASECGYIEIV